MSTKLSRRSLIKAMGMTAILAGLPRWSESAPIAHVVVVGGGFAGATAAKYLKMWGGASVEVSLIEPNRNYISPILSNLVLNQRVTLSKLTFNYTQHSTLYGVNMIHETVNLINAQNKRVTLSNGNVMDYDRLILAPGIEFDFVPGHDSDKVPHAWKAGPQTTLLEQQIDAMSDGEHFFMSVPKAPYRCPPGPYERACVVADYLRNAKGYANCQVTVLDENSGITVEADTFGAKFSEYGIDYRPNTAVQSIDSDTKTVTFANNGGGSETITVDVLNVIPNQKAGQIIFDTNLNEGNWAPVNPLNYESTKQTDIHIIGDSQATGQPKAGHIGNSEAKVCADAVLRSLNGLEPDPSPKTNSACYSPVSRTEATWLTGVFRYDATTGKMQPVDLGNTPNSGGPSLKNYSEMFNWSGNLFADTFS